jgi:hypothetical protein
MQSFHLLREDDSHVPFSAKVRSDGILVSESGEPFYNRNLISEGMREKIEALPPEEQLQSKALRACMIREDDPGEGYRLLNEQEWRVQSDLPRSEKGRTETVAEKVQSGEKAVEVTCVMQPHDKDLSDTLLNRPAPQGGMYRIRTWLPESLFKKVAEHSTYWDSGTLAQFDMFQATPGRYYVAEAIETLLGEGLRVSVQGIEIQSVDEISEAVRQRLEEQERRAEIKSKIQSAAEARAEKMERAEREGVGAALAEHTEELLRIGEVWPNEVIEDRRTLAKGYNCEAQTHRLNMDEAIEEARGESSPEEVAEDVEIKKTFAEKVEEGTSAVTGGRAIVHSVGNAKVAYVDSGTRVAAYKKELRRARENGRTGKVVLRALARSKEETGTGYRADYRSWIVEEKGDLIEETLPDVLPMKEAHPVGYIGKEAWMEIASEWGFQVEWLRSIPRAQQRRIAQEEETRVLAGAEGPKRIWRGDGRLWAEIPTGGNLGPDWNPQFGLVTWTEFAETMLRPRLSEEGRWVATFIRNAGTARSNALEEGYDIGEERAGVLEVSLGYMTRREAQSIARRLAEVPHYRTTLDRVEEGPAGPGGK